MPPKFTLTDTVHREHAKTEGDAHRIQIQRQAFIAILVAQPETQALFRSMPPPWIRRRPNPAINPLIGPYVTKRFSVFIPWIAEGLLLQYLAYTEARGNGGSISSSYTIEPINFPPVSPSSAAAMTDKVAFAAMLKEAAREHTERRGRIPRDTTSLVRDVIWWWQRYGKGWSRRAIAKQHVAGQSVHHGPEYIPVSQVTEATDHVTRRLGIDVGKLPNTK